jgi:hypothetical protein
MRRILAKMLTVGDHFVLSRALEFEAFINGAGPIELEVVHKPDTSAKSTG